MRFNAEQLINVLTGVVDKLRDTNDRQDATAAALGLLFWKRLSDEQERFPSLASSHKDLRFVMRVPSEARWSQLINQSPTGISKAFEQAQAALENANPSLPRVFSQGELFAALSSKRLGNREHLLFHILRDLQSVRLCDDELAEPDTLAQTFTGFLHRMAANDPTAGLSLTPPTVATLIASLVALRIGEKIYDPVCGSGGLLAACVARRAVSDDSPAPEVFGRDRSARLLALSCINLYFNRAKAELSVGDSLRDPPLERGSGDPASFDVVVANPPFSLPWDQQTVPQFHQHWSDIPLRSADYAFIQHALSVTNGRGRVAILMPHGVLFRSFGEEHIRRRLIEDDCFEAVIGLAPQLFYGTNIAVCLLIFNRAKPAQHRNRILFIDASRQFSRDRSVRQLSSEAISEITQSYRGFVSQPGYSRVVSKAEIADQDFDLSIARYVRAADGVAAVPLSSELATLRTLLDQRETVEREMFEALEQLPRKSNRKMSAD